MAKPILPLSSSAASAVPPDAARLLEIAALAAAEIRMEARIIARQAQAQLDDTTEGEP
ncbi:hypothetical protein [Piscirickettsia salmonis]|uniref:Uncharacterized protein n=1 Tax=Piscirickettsia salmonis TaxID=1238 RepID=A0A9Q6LSU7_PISSA|nr:hypothetical protein [Piscirickettsia salmonis]ALA25217.1 hypothetical protein KW89_1751 [Piscirickettsia salmonis]ERL60950.1 hypothetical protein K661_02728 [Piscirickettsia salmonis LF-89 = ATCC VR-1361]QGN77104.1 hypothetical protein Psal001_01308 [Piscirickettsia salmonis]QGN80693.1 hypothetical protein Psal002_01332 [Piscirickettsia salmonis]QGN85031.1 hypothetical protein Psal003_02096 [Piscirickettsia salmonis]